MSENYDVIIIGTGAGGGTLAYTLTTRSVKGAHRSLIFGEAPEARARIGVEKLQPCSVNVIPTRR